MSDVDQIQEVVTRPLGDVDPWDIRYCQTEGGSFDGSYVGAALPGQRTPFATSPAEACDTEPGIEGVLLREPALYVSRHWYSRALTITGCAPQKLIAFIVPLSERVAMRQKGHVVGPDQYMALGAGEELDTVITSATEFLSLRLDPDYVDRLRCALDKKNPFKPSAVLTPDGAALHALKRHIFRCFTLTAEDWIRDSGSIKSLALDIEESLIATLDSDGTQRTSLGLSRRRAIARAARDYMEANLHRRVGSRELSVATGVTTRTIQLAFKWYFGVTPNFFHKCLRFKQVRKDLKRFPAEEASVTAVALAWGFTHFGRFASEYKYLFGESPSMTLRRRY